MQLDAVFELGSIFGSASSVSLHLGERTVAEDAGFVVWSVPCFKCKMSLSAFIMHACMLGLCWGYAGVMLGSSEARSGGMALETTMTAYRSWYGMQTRR